MSTNFYYNVKNLDRWNHSTHIGKRSAAGLYCWDCKITLCKTGEVNIHISGNCHHSDSLCRCGWYDKCPKCGKSQIEESLNNSTVGRELGFNKSEPKKKSGVMSCSSFNWGVPKDAVKKYCKYAIFKKPIVDEYGRKYSFKEFEKMLLECPVQYINMIGQAFN